MKRSKTWLERLLGLPLTEPAESLDGLRLQTLALTEQVRKLTHDLKISRNAQAATDRRLQQLNNDWPSIFKRYFTLKGEDDQTNHRPTRSKRKPKGKRS